VTNAEDGSVDSTSTARSLPAVWDVASLGLGIWMSPRKLAAEHGGTTHPRRRRERVPPPHRTLGAWSPTRRCGYGVLLDRFWSASLATSAAARIAWLTTRTPPHHQCCSQPPIALVVRSMQYAGSSLLRAGLSSPYRSRTHHHSNTSSYAWWPKRSLSTLPRSTHLFSPQVLPRILLWLGPMYKASSSRSTKKLTFRIQEARGSHDHLPRLGGRCHA